MMVKASRLLKKIQQRGCDGHTDVAKKGTAKAGIKGAFVSRGCAGTALIREFYRYRCASRSSLASRRRRSCRTQPVTFPQQAHRCITDKRLA